MIPRFSGKPAHARSLTKAFAVRSHKIGIEKKLQAAKSQKSGPSGWPRRRI